MGYRVQRRTYLLVFPEDHNLHGLEIACRSISLGEVRAQREHARENAAADPYGFLDEQHKFFISNVKSWNLEDENGNRLPVSVDSLRTLASGDVNAVTAAWWNKCLGGEVEAPLGRPSNDGALLEEARLPMEISSESLPS